MPKIFSHQEMEKRKFPNLKDFAIVAGQIKKDLERCDEIVGGFIFGSVFHRKANVQSDIDLFVLYKKENEAKAFKSLQRAAKFAHNSNIPIEIIAIDDKNSSGRLNYIGPQFKHHLKLAENEGDLIKENPLTYLAEDAISKQEDWDGFFRSGLKKLQKGYARVHLMESDSYAFLGRMLRLPLHTARVVLFHNGIMLENDSDREVMKQYYNLVSVSKRDQDLYNLFHQLITVKESYSLSLNIQIENGYNKENYQGAIGRLIDSVPLFLDFLEKNAEMITIEAL